MAPLPPGYANAILPRSDNPCYKILCMFRTTYLCEQVFSVFPEIGFYTGFDA